MRIAPKIAKDKLNSAMTEIEAIKELFIREPKINFTRERKLTFGSVLTIMMKFSGKSLQNEISESFIPPGMYPASVPTKSAFIQQRNKILFEAGDPPDHLREMIRQDPKVTRKRMAAELGISERSVQRLLNSMTDVHFTGGGGRGHWVVDGE